MDIGIQMVLLVIFAIAYISWMSDFKGRIKIRRKKQQQNIDITTCINPEYENAKDRDKEYYEKIMKDINPEFDKGFDIIEKEKVVENAQYYKEKRESYIEKMIPEWKQDGIDVAIQIIEDLGKNAEEYPVSKLYYVGPFDYWVNGGEIETNKYYLLKEEGLYCCHEYLISKGFNIALNKNDRALEVHY